MYVAAPGHLAGSLAQSGANVVGLDFAMPMVAKARENYPSLDFRQGDAEALPFDAQTFDDVVCAFGVMHLSNADVAISEAFRVLRPVGRYIFTQWAQDDELLSIVLSAIAEHGEPVANLPNAPPAMRFSDPLECRRHQTMRSGSMSRKCLLGPFALPYRRNYVTMWAVRPTLCKLECSEDQTRCDLPCRPAGAL